MTAVITRRFATLAAVVCGIFVASCGDGLSQMQRRNIDAWLNCDECLEGERDSVRLMGDDAVPTLADALVGPPAEKRQIMEAKFEETYISLSIAGLTQTAYVSQLMSNYVATYQKRAAISLRDIATPEARRALDEAAAAASSRGYRDDVVSAVNFARATFNAVPYPGRITPNLVSFGDTVTVGAPKGMPFTFDEVVTLDGSPFPAADVLVSHTADKIRFLAVGDAGAHTLAVTNIGAKTTTAIAPLTIGSTLDVTDRAVKTCKDIDCERASAAGVSAAFLPDKTFLAFWRRPPRPDTLDLVKLQPAAALQVTAQVDWKGTADLDLEWRRCVDFAPIGGGVSSTTTTSEQRSHTIPAGECWLLTVIMRAGSGDRAFARLRFTSP